MASGIFSIYLSDLCLRGNILLGHQMYNIKLNAMKYTVTLCFVLTFFYIIPTFGQWTSTTGPFGPTQVGTLLTKDSKLIASTSCGVFVKDSDADNWSYYSSNTFLSYAESNGSLLVSSYSYPFGIWILDLSHVSEAPIRLYSGSTQIVASTDDLLFKYADYSGVARSTDYGTTWTNYNDGLPQTGNSGASEYNIGAMTIAGPYIYCSTDEGIYRNDINPNTWTLTNTGLPASKATFIYPSENLLYAAVGQTLYVSDDRGEHWVEVYTTTAPVTSMLKSGNLIYLGTEDGVMMSVDNGSGWKAVSAGLKDTHITCLTMYQSDLVCGTDHDGVYILQGNQWQRYGINLNCEPNFTLISGENGQSLISASHNKMYSYDNQSNSWNPMKTPFEDDITTSVTKMSLPVINQDTLSTFVNFWTNNQLPKSALLYSADNGLTWQGEENTTPFGDTDPEIIKEGNRIFGSGVGMLAITSNAGVTWKNITPANQTDINGHHWNGYNGYIYGINQDSKIIRFDNNYKYPKWTVEDNGIPADRKILAIANTDEALFAFASGEMYISTDNAADWSQVDVTLPFEQIRNWAFYKNLLFVTCDQGIFYTGDRGETWTSLNEGLSSPDLTNVNIAYGNIFVVNNVYAVFKRSLTDLLATHEKVVDNQLALYPNPAGEYFTIPSIAGQGSVSYTISDMKGAAVRSGHVADNGKVEVSSLSAGMYIVTVVSGKGNLTGKLIIQR